jgi:hypothetical protein
MIVLTAIRILREAFAEAIAMHHEMRRRYPYAFGED